MKRQPAQVYDGPKTPGIDVSKYQGVIDWGAVSRSEVRFAVVRTGDGRDTDPTAVRNLTGAHDAGLLVGVYHYIRARHGSAVNLDIILDVLRTAAVPIGFIAIDVEGAAANVRKARAGSGAWLGDVSTTEVMAVISEMVDELQRRGHMVVLYTGQAWHDHISRLGLRPPVGIPLWVPYYSHRDRPSVPTYIDGTRVWEPWTIWQYAGSKAVPGSCPGIVGNVDLNHFRGDEEALRAWMDPARRSTPLAPKPAPFRRSEIEALAMRAAASDDKPAALALIEALDGLGKG